jgi:hypothetical protein
MRTAISLLVSSFVFGSLALTSSGTVQELLSNPGSQQLLSVQPKKSKKPGQPVPHRGSGRREIMEYSSQSNPIA